MKFLPPSNLFTVITQLLLHPRHLVMEVSYCKLMISSRGSMVVFLFSYLSLAIRAAPKAPMIPAMSGLVTNPPEIFSNARSTASL